MAEEKRRLIYELLVEAKGAKKAQEEIGGISAGFGKLAKMAGPALGLLAAGFTVRGFAQALDDMTKFNQQLETLGVTGKNAADGLHAVQNIAVATGQAMTDVSGAFQSAVQLSQVLGRSTADAARTTDAFVRIAIAEGKTAAAAAAQIETLSFALDSGVLAGKQFNSMLRESNTFQSAAQNALGLTTAQLVALGKEGDITATQLTKIVIEMERVGLQKDAATTVGSLAQQFKNLFVVMAQGVGEGAGLGKTKLIDPDEIQTAQKLSDAARGLGKELGGLAGIAGDSVSRVYRELELLGTDLFGTETAEKNWANYKAKVDADMDDLDAHWKQVQEGWFMGTTSDPNYSPEAIAKRKAEREAANKAATDTAWNKDFSRSFGGSFDKSVESWKKAQAERAEQQRKFDAAAKEAREKRERDEMDAYIANLEAKGRIAEAAAKRQEQMEKDIQEGLKEFAKQNEKDIAESVKEQGDIRIEGLRKQVFEQIDVYTEAAYILKDAFADLFTGGIKNARDFFQTVAQGLARMFAQMAAMQAAEEIMGWAKSLLGGMTGGPAAGGGGGTWVAKGAAFNRGVVTPMAMGGIVSRPTVFPMASGGVGLMGEAGPEAVMPLRRMASGRLGVSAGQPNITIVNQTGVAATARVSHSGDRLSIVMEAAQMGASIAEDRINRSLRTGYGASAQSVQTVYGLRRRV